MPTAQHDGEEGDTLDRQQAPTRQAVLIAHAEDYRRRSGLPHEEWAEAVDTQYCARVAEAHRTLPAPDLARVNGAEEWQKLRRAWDQTIRRYVSGELRFPVELEEAWRHALAEPWRTECLRELVARDGLHYAPKYEQGSAGTYEGLGNLTEQFADVQRALADGCVDREDIPELTRLVDAAQAMIHRGRNNLRRVS